MSLLIKTLCAIAAVISVAGIVCMAVLEGEGGQPDLLGLLLLVIGIVVGMPPLIFGASSPGGRDELDKLRARMRSKTYRKKIRRLGTIFKYLGYSSLLAFVVLLVVGIILFVSGSTGFQGAFVAALVLFCMMWVFASLCDLVDWLGDIKRHRKSKFEKKLSEKAEKFGQWVALIFAFIMGGSLLLGIIAAVLLVIVLAIAMPFALWGAWDSGTNFEGMVVIAVAFVLLVVGYGSFLIWHFRSNKKKAPGVRVFALAKELNMTSKELISFLKTEGHKVSSHMSSIDKSAAKALRKRLKLKAGEAPAEKPGKKAG